MSTGLLINYRWCTGCHSCEVACRTEHGFSEEEFGIKVTEYIWPRNPEGVDWQHADTWQYTYFPMPLDACDLCAERVAAGSKPTCVHHCQAQCLEYGELAELAQKLTENPKQSLFYLG